MDRRVRRLGVGLVSAIASFVIATASGTAASPGAPTGKLLFCKGSSKCGKALYVANGDGSNVRLLANTPVIPWNVSWSPRGDRFVFTGKHVLDASGLYEGTVDGKIREVTSSLISGFSWSPTGNSFVYAKGSASSADSLVVVSSSSLSQHMVGFCPLQNGNLPSYSPDGSKIAYSFVSLNGACANGHSGIAVLDVRTGRSRIVFNDRGAEALGLIGWRNNANLLVIDGYPNPLDGHLRQLSLGGRITKVLPTDPGPLLGASLNGYLTDGPSLSVLSSDRRYALIDYCPNNGCSITPQILDLVTHKLSYALPGYAAGWSKIGDEQMTYSVDSSKASTTLSLVAGTDLTQSWTVDLLMPVAAVAWTG